MDDRIYDEFGSKRRPAQGANNQKKNSKAGDFKVSINFDEVEAKEAKAPKPQATTSYLGFNFTNDAPVKDNRFRVSIPENQTSRPEVSKPKTAAESVQRRPAAQSAKKPAASQSEKKAASSQAPKTKSASGKEPARSTTEKKKKSKPQSAKQKQAKKYNRTKSSLIVCVCLIVIVVLTTVLSTIALETVNDILAINKKGSETVSVVIPDDAKFEDVYKILTDNDLVKQKLIVKLFCLFRNYDGYYKTDKETGEKTWVDVKYQPGVYYLETSDGIEAMLETIKGSTVSKDTVRVTFPEGSTVAQIFEKLEKNNVCTAEKLYANLDIIGKQFDFYEEIEANSGRYLKAEGYLFPDTYDFYVDESASSVLKKLFGNFNSKWTEEYDKQAKKLGMTMDEVIILASIIEREAKGESQMANISSVLHNRLDDPATYPQLQMNSTKDYIDSTKEYGVFTDNYYTIYLDSYNTYNVIGLPPGAICNPGADAIKAALYPADTDYHFFCHDSEGNAYYAVTAAEHERNTQKIL